MPRGIKREKNYVEEIEKVQTQIARHDEIVRSLKKQLVTLQSEQKQDSLVKLSKLIEETGLTIEALTSIVEKKQKPNSSTPFKDYSKDTASL